MGTKLPFPAGRRVGPAADAPRPRTAFVLSGGGNQGVSQVGHAPRPARAGNPARRRDRDLGRRAQRRGRRLRPEPHRRRPARRRVGAAPGRPRLPRWAASTGPGTSCAEAPISSATRASPASSTTPPRPARSPTSRSRCASSRPTSTPARRSCSPRPAQARAARERRAAGSLPDRGPRRPPARRRRRRQQRPAVARAVGAGRPGLRAERVVRASATTPCGRRSTS